MAPSGSRCSRGCLRRGPRCRWPARSLRSGHANAAEHGPGGVLEFHPCAGRLSQPQHAAREIDVPGHQIVAALTDQVLLVAVRVYPLHLLGRQGVQQQPVAAPAEAAVHPQLLNVHRQRVTRLRPFHVEGAGLRVRRLRDPDAALVLPARVDDLGGDDLAGADPVEHRVSPPEGVVVSLRHYLPHLTRQQGRHAERGAEDVPFHSLPTWPSQYRSRTYPNAPACHFCKFTSPLRRNGFCER